MGWPHDVVHACLHVCMHEWCAPALAVVALALALVLSKPNDCVHVRGELLRRSRRLFRRVFGLAVLRLHVLQLQLLQLLGQCRFGHLQLQAQSQGLEGCFGHQGQCCIGRLQVQRRAAAEEEEAPELALLDAARIATPL